MQDYFKKNNFEFINVMQIFFTYRLNMIQKIQNYLIKKYFS